MNSDFEQLRNHVTASKTAWLVCPLPDEIPKVPDNPFAGLDVSALLDAPPQLLAHVLRTKATGGVEVMSPRAIPMLATIQRVDPFRRTADQIVVSTQASTNTTWPTMDGRTLDHLFPNEPNRSAVGDMAVVSRTAVHAIGPTTPEMRYADPIAKAVVKAASFLDVQRRDDVKGDAAVLGEVLDVAWGVPRGVFSSFAPVVICGSADLLRTAIGADRVAPDALMPVQAKKYVGVDGGSQTRLDYGPDIGIDWGRQRGVARTIYYRTMMLEGQSFLPTRKTWPAADRRAPVHSTERDKVLVFQPAYGSAFYIGAETFTFRKPPMDVVPARFRKCDGSSATTLIVTPEDLNGVALQLLAAKVPHQAVAAICSVLKTHVVREIVLGERPVATVRLRPVTSATIMAPISSSLVAARDLLKVHMVDRLARGATSHKVIRARVMHVMESIADADMAPAFYTVKQLKDHASLLGIVQPSKGMIHQIGTRLSYSLGTPMVHSLAVEATRMGSTLDEWFESALDVMPTELRPAANTTVGWAIFAAYALWASISTKWRSSLSMANRAYLRQIATNSVVEAAYTYSLDTPPDSRMDAAAKASCRKSNDTYGAYYESMYDVYEILARNQKFPIPSPYETPDDIVRRTMAHKARHDAIRAGALLWQFRGRFIRTVHVVVHEHTPTDVSPFRAYAHGRLYEVKASPYKAYAALRSEFLGLDNIRADFDLPVVKDGNVMRVFETARGPLVNLAMTDEDYDEEYDDMYHWPAPFEVKFEKSRLGRYVMKPRLLFHDLERNMAEMLEDVVHSAAAAIRRATTLMPNEIVNRVSAVEQASSTPVAPAAAYVPPAPPVEAQLAAPDEVFRAASSSAAALIGAHSTTNGWACLSAFGDESAEWMDEMEEKLTEEEFDAIMSANYASPEVFADLVATKLGHLDPIGSAAVDDEYTAALRIPK